MGKTRYILAGKLIDGSSNDVRRNVFLAVKNTIITAIGSIADLPCNNELIKEDFSHCTIVPALVDCSLFLSQSPSIDLNVLSALEKADLTQKAAILEQHIKYCHAHGVLGVADNENISHLLADHKKWKTDGSLIDLRMPYQLCQKNQILQESSPADGDFLKVFYTGTIEEYSGNPLLNPKNLRQILKHRVDKKSVVVANGPQQVTDAIEAGCNAIEQGYMMGEDNLQKMAEMGIVWIPSVLLAKNGLDSAGSGGEICCRFSQRYVAPGKQSPTSEAHWKKVLTNQMTQLQLARKFGITMAIGTSAGSTGILHGESMVEEMKLFMKAGYTLEQTIRCASENGARFFDMEDLGSIAVGRPATFLIARGSVKQLPRKLSYLEGIYIKGQPSLLYHKNPI